MPNCIKVPQAAGFGEIEKFNRFVLDCVPWPEQFPYKPKVEVAIAHSEEYRTEGFFTTVLYKKRPTSSRNVIDNVIDNVIENVGDNLKGKAKREQIIVEMMRLKPNISFAELAQALNVAERTIARDVAHLRETKKIARQGGDKGGEWIIL